MATIKQHFEADVFQFRSTAFPSYTMVDGTAVPQSGLKFDATAEEAAYVRTRAINYPGTGSWTITLDWYADTASSGGVTWGVSVAAITANTDTQDVETKAYATETTFSDTHLGTTGQRAHSVSATISNLDSVAGDDWVSIRIARKPADAGDTMTGDAILTMMDIAYSDS